MAGGWKCSMVVLALGLGWSSAQWNIPGATLSATFADVPVGSVVDLSTQGPVDWIHWGTFTEFASDRKAGVIPQINEFTIIGTTIDGPYQFSDNYNGYSWCDGSPNAAVTNTTTGVYKFNKFDGFQFTVPADTSVKVLKVYVGAFAAEGKFEASLSDSSAPGYSSSALDNETNGPSGVYTVQFAAASSNKFLTVKFTADSLHDNRYGNVTLQAAALSFATLNDPPIICLNAPVKNQTYPATTDLVLEANAFDTDGVITSVTFFEGTNQLGEVTNAPYTFIWSNAPPGTYLLSARATDDHGASYTGSPVTVFGHLTGGILTGSLALPATSIALNAEGSDDWTHWGLLTTNSFDRKVSLSPQISDFTKIGTNKVQRLTDGRTGFSWTDGTPTATASDSTTGIFINGLTNGFELMLPAGTRRRTARVYSGVYAARGNFEATLSDFSAPAFANSFLINLYNNSYRVYTVTYAAASENQVLRIRFTADALFDATFGNTVLQSVTLATDLPAAVSISNLLVSSNDFQFRFGTEPGYVYSIETSDLSVPIQWQTLTNFAGTGGEIFFSEPCTDTNRCYRVVAE